MSLNQTLEFNASSQVLNGLQAESPDKLCVFDLTPTENAESKLAGVEEGVKTKSRGSKRLKNQ